MRNVTREVCGAFMRHEKLSVGNTNTDGVTLFLHGNAIARHTFQGLEITTAGRESKTTRERLCGLPGVLVTQKAGQQYLNGRVWESSHVWTNVMAHGNA